MSDPNGLEALVQTLSGVIARARTEVEAGNLVDLTAVEAAVNELCGDATALSPSDGNSLRPRLLALMDDFGHLSRSIETRLVEIKRELGNTGGRQNALRAYGKTPGPSQ